MTDRRVIVSKYQHYFVNGFYCREDMYSTSHPNAVGGEGSIEIHMANRRYATRALDNFRDGGYIDMKLPNSDKWVGMARKRDVIYLELIFNKMYCEFRKSPSLMLLGVMASELKDEQATSTEIERFERVCLGYLR